MVRFVKAATAAVGICCSTLSLADVIVIDFNNISTGGQFSTPQFEDGFVIDPALAPFDPVIDTLPGQMGSDGTPFLFFCGWCADDATEGVSIYSQTGLTFELDSLDAFSGGALPLQNFQGTGMVTGHFPGGGTISQAFSANIAIDTVLFDDAWTNLTSIDIEFSVSSFYPAFVVPAVDNITLQAVPIPAAVWLFGSALAGLGWLRRRQTV